MQVARPSWIVMWGVLAVSLTLVVLAPSPVGPGLDPGGMALAVMVCLLFLMDERSGRLRRQVRATFAHGAGWRCLGLLCAVEILYLGLPQGSLPVLSWALLSMLGLVTCLAMRGLWQSRGRDPRLGHARPFAIGTLGVAVLAPYAAALKTVL